MIHFQDRLGADMRKELRKRDCVFSQVGYHADAGPKMLARVVKTGTGKWKELCKRISDAKFGGAGPGGSDLWLENADGYDDVFSSLEVAEGSPESLAFSGCNANAADDDDAVVGYR
jgi:hypothetical protein